MDCIIKPAVRLSAQWMVMALATPHPMRGDLARRAAETICLQGGPQLLLSRQKHPGCGKVSFNAFLLRSQTRLYRLAMRWMVMLLATAHPVHGDRPGRRAATVDDTSDSKTFSR